MIKSLLLIVFYLFLINKAVLGSESETNDFSDHDIESVSLSMTSSTTESSTDTGEVIDRVRQANLVQDPYLSSPDYCLNLIMILIPANISLFSVIFMMAKFDGQAPLIMIKFSIGLAIIIFILVIVRDPDMRRLNSS